MGLMDEVGAACDGVRTVCDHTKNAVRTIPIVPAEKNSLRIVAASVFAK